MRLYEGVEYALMANVLAPEFSGDRVKDWGGERVCGDFWGGERSGQAKDFRRSWLWRRIGLRKDKIGGME